MRINLCAAVHIKEPCSATYRMSNDLVSCMILANVSRHSSTVNEHKNACHPIASSSILKSSKKTAVAVVRV